MADWNCATGGGQTLSLPGGCGCTVTINIHCGGGSADGQSIISGPAPIVGDPPDPDGRWFIRPGNDAGAMRLDMSGIDPHADQWGYQADFKGGPASDPLSVWMCTQAFPGKQKYIGFAVTEWKGSGSAFDVALGSTSSSTDTLGITEPTGNAWPIRFVSVDTPGAGVVEVKVKRSVATSYSDYLVVMPIDPLPSKSVTWSVYQSWGAIEPIGWDSTGLVGEAKASVDEVLASNRYAVFVVRGGPESSGWAFDPEIESPTKIYTSI